MIVLDCSAAISIAFDTAEGQALSSFILDGERIIAPKIFYAELAHTLTKYVKEHRLSFEQASEKGNAALSLIDAFYEDRDFYAEVLSESIRLNHSTHDLFYFLLAKRTAATLFTLDKKLVTLCEKEGAKCLRKVAL